MNSSMTRQRLVITCLVIFAFAAGVRLVVWQNNKLDMREVQSVVSATYKQDASYLLSGDTGGFIEGPDPPSDANILGHPPGYPIFIAGVWSVFGQNDSLLIVQIFFNALAALFVFGIALELFDLRTALFAAILVCIAPQFAYHAGIALPDELSVVPILAALWILVRSRQTPGILPAFGIGALLGISCWLRANGMLLPLFFAAAVLIMFPGASRIRFAGAVIAAFIAVIAPITIRNMVVFHAFIPLSLGTGTTFLEGLGDYDTDGRLKLPKLDEDVMRWDAERTGRADYYGYLFAPDGVERDRARIADGISVVASHPLWYLKAVAHRGMTSFRMERVPAIDIDRDERVSTPALLYYLNVPLKMLQRLFVTALILPLFLLGAAVTLRTEGGGAKLALLLIVPLYFATVQSLLHTEYRYVLATPHIMMIFAAAGLTSAAGKIRPVQTSTA